MEIKLRTQQPRQVVDITDQVQKQVEGGSKLTVVYVAHTTCAVTTADLDPGTDLDLIDAVWEMIPKLKYRHPHNPSHVPAHLASSIIGSSMTIPVRDGRLVLGTWQRIILVELDGPRERQLFISNL